MIAKARDGDPAGGRNAEHLVLWTVGHSTRSLADLIEILRSVGATLLIDVRTVPRSRRNPQFNRDSLPAALGPSGIEYRHEPRLGGFRKPRQDSPNSAWRNASFRGFADYAQTPDFEGAVSELLSLASRERVVLMCAEALPYRCHRTIIADALSARGAEVRHLTAPGRAEPHRLTPWARVEAGRVTYPEEGAAGDRAGGNEVSRES